MKSKNSEATYIGFTTNLRLRIAQHNNRLSFSTKNNAPWELVYYEAFRGKIDAMERERMLKYDGKAKTMLKKRIEESLNQKGAA